VEVGLGVLSWGVGGGRGGGGGVTRCVQTGCGVGWGWTPHPEGAGGRFFEEFSGDRVRGWRGTQGGVGGGSWVSGGLLVGGDEGV